MSPPIQTMAVTPKIIPRWFNVFFYVTKRLLKKSGIIFIPSHLVEEVVINAEFIALRDQFGHQRLREGKYTPGEIDQQWTDEIKKDFLSWINQNPNKLPMSRPELDAFMKDRTW